MKKKFIIFLLVNLSSLFIATAQIAEKHLSNIADEWTAENNKENFTQKLARLKVNGHLVAVTFSCPDTLRVGRLESYLRNQPGYGQLAPLATGDNYILFDEKKYFLQIQDKILEKLKASFDPDLFVKLDINEIPEVQHGFDKYRDFWKTKYKVVVNIDLWAGIDGNTQEDLNHKNTTISARFFVRGYVFITEYQVKKGKENANNLSGMIPPEFKTYSSERLAKEYKKGEEPDNIKFIDPLINRKRGEDLYKVFSADLDNVMNAMIKKLSK